MKVRCALLGKLVRIISFNLLSDTLPKSESQNIAEPLHYTE